MQSKAGGEGRQRLIKHADDKLVSRTTKPKVSRVAKQANWLSISQARLSGANKHSQAWLTATESACHLAGGQLGTV